jgi:hypothetical protein
VICAFDGSVLADKGDVAVVAHPERNNGNAMAKHRLDNLLVMATLLSRSAQSDLRLARYRVARAILVSSWLVREGNDVRGFAPGHGIRDHVWSAASSRDALKTHGRAAIGRRKCGGPSSRYRSDTAALIAPLHRTARFDTTPLLYDRQGAPTNQKTRIAVFQTVCVCRISVEADPFGQS